MQGGDTGEKETNQGGLCRHAKELGHYSVYDREVLKPESAFIKLCLCVCVCVWCVCVQACVCVCLRNLSNFGMVVVKGLWYDCRQGDQLRSNR